MVLKDMEQIQLVTSSDNGWKEVFVLGRYGWEKNGMLLIIVRKNKWIVEIGRKHLGSTEIREEAFRIANEYMKKN